MYSWLEKYLYVISGTVNFVWFVLWMLLVSDNPMEHKRISKIEQEYIVMSLAESRHAETGKVIYKKIISIYSNKYITKTLHRKLKIKQHKTHQFQGYIQH